MGEDSLSCLTCVLSFCLFEQSNMFKVVNRENEDNVYIANHHLYNYIVYE